jgi:diamine N-acetyltransferase
MKTIRLRALEPEDLDLLYTIENDRALWAVGCATTPYSRYLLHDYLANATGDIYVDKQVRMVIEDQEHQAIGLVDLFNFSPQHLRAEVGIVIQQPFRNNGYANMALQALCDYSRNILHLHQLYAIVADDNEAALQMFRQSSFTISSELKEWIYNGEKYQNAYLLQTFL